MNLHSYAFSTTNTNTAVAKNIAPCQIATADETIVVLRGTTIVVTSLVMVCTFRNTLQLHSLTTVQTKTGHAHLHVEIAETIAAEIARHREVPHRELDRQDDPIETATISAAATQMAHLPEERETTEA